MLLLESESAIGSDWVQHEVAYALSHRIAVLALALPGIDVEDQFEVIDDAFRLRLAGSDLVGVGPAGTWTIRLCSACSTRSSGDTPARSAAAASSCSEAQATSSCAPGGRGHRWTAGRGWQREARNASSS